jgi:GGDEF domain-containing protein
VISLKSYLLRDSGDEAEAAYRRIISLLLQGIALHAVEGDQADFDRFRAELDKSQKTVTPETPIAELLVIVGGVLRSMEEYNQRTSKFVHRQNTELQLMVSMLTQTVISIGSSSDRSVAKLQEIDKAIERTSQVEDIQILKLRLGECLEAVREETNRQKKDGASALQTLKGELENAHERMGTVALRHALDTATGLPAKGEAETAIEAATVAPHTTYLLIAVCSRIQAINARFGYAVGDRILAAFAEHFRKSLPRDKIFRWQGPALVALLERTDRIDRVRSEIRQFADTKLEKTIEVGRRTVLIPISASWSLLHVAPPYEAFVKQIDAFSAAQIPRDFA